MARRKRKSSSARVVAGLSVIRRQNDVLEPVYEADPDERPVVHHRTVGVGSAMILQPFSSKNADAFGDSDAIPSWPVPKINCLHPFSKTNFASSSETVCELP